MAIVMGQDIERKRERERETPLTLDIAGELLEGMARLAPVETAACVFVGPLCVMRLMAYLGGRQALQREVMKASRGEVIPSFPHR